MSHSKIANAKGQNLAYFYHKGDENLPTIVFCGGFKSDMMGSKATFLEEQAKARGQGYVRFDYTGHGISDGEFVDGTIGAWCEDTLTIIDQVTQGDLIMVGSSMGGWLSLLCALKRPERVKALMGIAAAPDFTAELHERFSDAQKEELIKTGEVRVPNDYSDEPYIFTKALIEDGKDNFVLHADRPMDIQCPVYLMQGMQDADVPWQTAIAISDHLVGDNVIIELIKDANHSVSRPEDLERLNGAILHLNRLV